jgi:hypothetical protein
MVSNRIDVNLDSFFETYLDLLHHILKFVWPACAHDHFNPDVEAGHYQTKNTPNLRFSCLNPAEIDYLKDEDPFTIEAKIRRLLTEIPVFRGSVKLFLYPGMFYGKPLNNKFKALCLDFESPCHGQIFSAAECYYRSLGAPIDLDHYFVESMVPIAGRTASEMTIFMGS